MATIPQALLLLLCLIVVALAQTTPCSTYKVINSQNLSTAAISYLTSITVEACDDTTDTLSFVQETSKLASEIYNCQGCVAVSGGPIGETYWGTLDSTWFLELNVGNYHVLLFVSRDCVLLAPEYRTPVYTLSDSEAEGQRVCICSSFTWYTTEGINVYEKYELEEAAQTACSCSTSLRSYVEELASFLTYYDDPANTLASSTEESAFAVSYDWYATFRVGCYYTLVFRAGKCTGYQPPKTFPTPTAIIGAASQSTTPQPSVSPSRSHSATPTRAAGVSLSPSPTRSPPTAGCGNPPCNNHGVCQNNQCHCETFYYGPQCQNEYCPGNCSYNGVCNPNSGECQCTYPYYGCDCSEQLYNCTCEHGTCDPLSGNCTCDLGWTGTNCTVSVACQNNCYNHGRCSINETCDCFPGWTGEYCNITDTNCSKGCYNGGYCENGVCVCPEPYFGPLCRMMHCGTGGTNRTCAGHGKCNHETGSCFCYPGYSGCYCTQYNGTSTPPPPSPLPSHRPPSPSRTPSPSKVISGCGNPPCNNHGICQNNQCHCQSFYYGPQCQYQFCPGNCTNQGYCNPNSGECQCYYPYYGCDCSEQLYNCTCYHGTCDPLSGNCTCEVGWTGTNCNVSVACQNNCNNHGRCNANQTCECFPGWTGSDCSTHNPNCTNGCQNGGYCNNVTGTCSCPEPYFGPECKWLHCGTGGTNVTCSGHGRCNYYTGSCYCDNGFSGCYCTNWSGSGSPPPAASQVPLPPSLECPTVDSVCSGHGECNPSNGQCYCDEGWSGCYCNQFS